MNNENAKFTQSKAFPYIKITTFNVIKKKNCLWRQAHPTKRIKNKTLHSQDEDEISLNADRNC